MADSEEPQLIKDLANLIREKGHEVVAEVDFDYPDTWAYRLPDRLHYPGVDAVFFQASDEYTNRVYLGNTIHPLEGDHLDVRENTFDGVRYQKGSADDLKQLAFVLTGDISECKAEMIRVDEQRSKEGFAVRDGMGRQKL